MPTPSHRGPQSRRRDPTRERAAHGALDRGAPPILRALILLLAGASLLAPGPARAGVTFYTDESAWTAAVSAAAVEPFDTTAANLAKADQLAGAPVQDEDLGSWLRFRAQDTGLCGHFTLHAIEPGAHLVFEDGEPSPAVFPANTISIGDIDDHEDDDFRITFPTESFHAVGFFLVDNAQDPGESLTAYGPKGPLGTLDGASIPDSSGGGSTFVGVVADETLSVLRFEEAASGDDVAIRDLRSAFWKGGVRTRIRFGGC